MLFTVFFHHSRKGQESFKCEVRNNRENSRKIICLFSPLERTIFHQELQKRVTNKTIIPTSGPSW